ncbi:MAG: winged helix-turn-helix domain-containing protein [Paracoccaceae bacterium]
MSSEIGEDECTQQDGSLQDVMPRLVAAGPLTLDLFHRDARVGKDWIGLHPREFALLWRLAEAPGSLIMRRQLLREVWRLHHEPETNTVEVHVARLRAKLAVHGLEGMIRTGFQGGYALHIDTQASVFDLGPD